MIKTLLLSTALCCAASAQAAETLVDLTCGPATVAIGQAGTNGVTTTRVVVYDSGQWTVIHTLANGQTVSRAAQYSMQDASEEFQKADKRWAIGWKGVSNRNPNLLMRGGIAREADGPVLYQEGLFDNGKLTMSSASACAVNYIVKPAPSAPQELSDSVPITVTEAGIIVSVIAGGRSLNMFIDTGASISSINTAFADQLIHDGHATEGPRLTVGFADGSSHEERTVIVDQITIGAHARTQVRMSVSEGPSLLGMPVLSAIGRFSIDAAHGLLAFN